LRILDPTDFHKYPYLIARSVFVLAGRCAPWVLASGFSTPLENDFQLDWSAERKACDSHTPGDKGSSLFRRRLAAAPKRRAWSFSFVEKRGWPEVYGSPEIGGG
jgi:hypothetical protein